MIALSDNDAQIQNYHKTRHQDIRSHLFALCWDLITKICVLSGFS